MLLLTHPSAYFASSNKKQAKVYKLSTKREKVSAVLTVPCNHLAWLLPNSDITGAQPTPRNVEIVTLCSHGMNKKGNKIIYGRNK